MIEARIWQQQTTPSSFFRHDSAQLPVKDYLNHIPIPVPAILMFVPGMPVVGNQNTHHGLKLVNGAGYTALDVISTRRIPAIASVGQPSFTSAHRRAFCWRR